MSISGPLIADAKAEEATLEAVVTRADGSVENLGTIAYWHRNPFKRWAWRLARLIRRKA